MDKKIKTWLERKIYMDSDAAEDNEHYDNMVAMDWDLPSGWDALSFMRKRVSTAAFDIIKQACNIYDTFHPKFEVLPRNPNDAEAAERLERWGEWLMRQANQVGEKEPFRTVMKHSATYDKIRIQVEYTKDQRKPFILLPYHPSIVHHDMGADGCPLRVAVVNSVLASEVIEHWEPFESENTVKKALKELGDIVDTDPEQRVLYADYVEKNRDGKRRYVVYALTDSESVPSEYSFPEDATVILDKQSRGFIPWVIVTGTSGSILESLHKSSLWENQNLLDTLSDTTVMRRAWFPLIKHTSTTGKQLDVDFSVDANGVVEQTAGEDTQVMVPPPLDPGIRELMDRNTAKMNSTSGVQNIASMEAANVQFATVDALIKLKMTELEPYARNAEKALAEVLRLMFLFVKAEEATLPAQRSADSRYGKKGEVINVSPKDFDPSALVVTCTLLENDKTGWMQKANAFAMLAKSGLKIPSDEYVERLDLGDPDSLAKRWTKEQVENAMFQLWVQQKQMELQMQTQMQIAQAQGQTNPSQAQPAFDQAGQMMNPNQGGPSPMMGMPEGTQTQMRAMEGQ